MKGLLLNMFFAALLATFTTDSDLEGEVRNAIQNDHDISSYGRSVQVAVKDGVVTLTGQVKGKAEKKKVVRVAKKIKGVTHVNDKLTTTFKD